MRSCNRTAHTKDGQRSPRQRRPSAVTGPWELLRSQGDPTAPPAGAAPAPASARSSAGTARPSRPLTDTSLNTWVLLDKSAFSLFLFVCWLRP